MDEKHQDSTLLPIEEHRPYSDGSEAQEQSAQFQGLYIQTWATTATSPRWWRRSPSALAPSLCSNRSSIPTGSSASSPRRQRILFNLQDSRERMLLVLLALCTCWYWLGSQAATTSDPIDAILKETPLIDTHIDFPIFLRLFRQNHINNLTADDELPGQVDFPRLRKGKLGAAFWSVYVPCPKDDSSVEDPDERFSNALYNESVSMTFEQLDLVHRLVRRFPDDLSLTFTSSAIFHNHQFPPEYRTIGSVAGGEGLHSIGNRAANLRLFHSLGMRYMTLAHNCHNRYADAAIADSPPVHGGLSARGRAMVLEMNRLGMMVDVSHVSADAMRAAIATSEAPVIFSHSGARGVRDHPRNVPDDVLDSLRARDGVVQVPFLPEFVSDAPDGAALADVADHIVYIGRRIGFQHVGIGSDFDGMPAPVRGLEDVAKYPDLLRELWKRGLTQKELAGVVGKNLLRVMAKVEAVAATSTRAPLEDEVHFGINGSSAM